MKKLFLALGAFSAVPVHAAADPAPLSPLIVVGTRSEQNQNRLPAAVTVITRADLERMGAQHIADALRTVGALQVTDLYGDGSRATIDARGFGDAAGSTTLILVDGRRLNNPDIAPPDLDAIALQDVERIEILDGSAGTLYGDEAVGGVINIVLRAPARFAANAGATVGSFDAQGVRGSVAQRWDAASFRLSAEGRRSDNYREHNALEKQNVLARVGYEGAAGGVFVEGSYVSDNLQTPGPLFADEMAANRRQSTAPFREDFSDTNTSVIHVNAHEALGADWRFEADVDQRLSFGDFRLSFASGSSSPGTQERVIRAAHPRLEGTLAGALVTTGADVQIADYALDSTAYGRQANRQKLADFYAQAMLPLPARVELTIGARYARVDNQVQDGYTFTTPTKFHDTQPATELGVAWRAIDAVRLYARYDRIFRFAKVDEFTLACPSSSDAKLDTQRGGSYEAGAEYAQGRARLRAAAYRLDLEDEIAFDPNTCFGANINLDATRRDGVLLEGGWSPTDGLALEASVQHLDSEIRGGSLTGRAIPLVARNMAKLAMSAVLPAQLDARVEAQAIDQRPLAGDFDNTLARLPGFAVVNLGFGWTGRAISVGARINNLLDHAYAEYGTAAFDAAFMKAAAYFPSPERNIRVTADYRW